MEQVDTDKHRHSQSINGQERPGVCLERECHWATCSADPELAGYTILSAQQRLL